MDRATKGHAGLAVTLKPFHIANAGFDPLPVTRTAVTVADAAEIESLVRIADTPPGQLLLDRAADEVRRTWSLDTAFQGHARERNPVLDQARDSYPWASAARAYRESSQPDHRHEAPKDHHRDRLERHNRDHATRHRRCSAPES